MSTLISDNIKGRGDAKVVNVFAGHATNSTRTTNLEQGLAKVWINVDGTSVTSNVDTAGVRDSFNVGSIVDVATGKHTINYTNDFVNNDYAIVGIARSPSVRSGMIQAPTDAESDAAVGSLEFYSTDVGGTPFDLNHLNLVIHGDLA